MIASTAAWGARCCMASVLCRQSRRIAASNADTNVATTDLEEIDPITGQVISRQGDNVAQGTAPQSLPFPLDFRHLHSASLSRADIHPSIASAFTHIAHVSALHPCTMLLLLSSPTPPFSSPGPSAASLP